MLYGLCLANGKIRLIRSSGVWYVKHINLELPILSQVVGNCHSALRRGTQCMQPAPFIALEVFWIPRRSAEWQLPRASLFVGCIYLPFLHIYTWTADEPKILCSQPTAQGFCCAVSCCSASGRRTTCGGTWANNAHKTRWSGCAKPCGRRCCYDPGNSNNIPLWV